jgi:hypothetical protein
MEHKMNDSEPMQKYFGTKLIMALAMTRLEYNNYRKWDLPADERGDDAGYLVEYIDGGGSNHSAHKGYISWSPKAVFDLSYQPLTQMSFGHALVALKMGKRVARKGWNGKGMWLELQVPDAHSKMTLPYIFMKTACDNQVPWLASQTDLLADDWQEVAPTA